MFEREAEQALGQYVEIDGRIGEVTGYRFDAGDELPVFTVDYAGELGRVVDYAAVTDGLIDGERHSRAFPGADYVVSYVDRAGSPCDFAHFHTDLAAALYRAALERQRPNVENGHALVFVYDGDDPERGSFDADYDWDLDGDVIVARAERRAAR